MSGKESRPQPEVLMAKFALIKFFFSQVYPWASKIILTEEKFHQSRFSHQNFKVEGEIPFHSFAPVIIGEWNGAGEVEWS